MRVWVERGFSRLHIARRMLAADPRLLLLTDPAQTPAGGIALATPAGTSPDRVEAIAAMCREHDVDAFWPQRSATLDLSPLSCAVHAAATPDVIALVDDKDAFMRWLGDDPHRPDQVEVLGAGGVEIEYEKRRREGRDTCVKPVVGVNGHGYWRLTPHSPGAFLDDPEPREIDMATWATAMRHGELYTGPRRMLVMDWLPGPEVSIDLLCWRGEPLTHAARVKTDADRQVVSAEHPTVDHARDVARRLGLHGIVSMQYRLDAEGAWRMLEVNPRPAGGCIHSEDAGFGIITDWTRLLTGLADPGDVRQHDARVVLAFERTARIVADGAWG